MSTSHPSPSTVPVSDRRTARTRAALRDALLQLMAQKGWDDVSVQDICERADVGRSTFYTHFDTKEALLSAGFEELRALIASDAGSCARSREEGSLGFVLGLIVHVGENRQLFRAMIGRRSGHPVQQRFRDMVAGAVADELPAMPVDVPREAAVRWLTGALFELLAWWVESPGQIAAPHLNRLFARMSASLLGPRC